MAAGLDIAAGALGIVGIAQQLAESVYKIHAFYKDVRDAPAELLDTIASLEHVSNILIRLAEEQQVAPNTIACQGIFYASLELCQRAVERVATVATELQKDLRQKRYRTGIKFVLKRRDTKAMLERLDRSKIDLLLAYSMYTDARRASEAENKQAQIMAIVETLSVRDIKTAAEEGQEPEQLHRLPRKSSSARTVERIGGVRVRLPFWMRQYACDVAFERASGRWTVSLSTSRVFDFGVWYMVRTGELDRIRDLLERRQLSIHDTTEDGDGLFSIAAKYGRTDVAKYLLEKGASPTWRAITDILLKERAPFYRSEDPLSGRIDGTIDSLRSHAQLLLEYGENVSHKVAKDLDIFAKTPMRWSCAERLQLLSMFGTYSSNECFYTFLGGENLDPQLFHVPSPLGGVTLMHHFATRWGNEKYYRSVGPEPICDWFSLIDQAVKAGADLHATDTDTRTPLMTFLEGTRVAEKQAALQNWVKTLERAGVNLQTYGEVEQELMQRIAYWEHEYHESRQIVERRLGVVMPRTGEAEVLGLGYGPRPSDWHLWVRNPGDAFAGTFWHMVEHPELAMPGAWPEPEEGVCGYGERRGSPWTRAVGVKRRTLRRIKSEIKAAGGVQSEAPYHFESVAELFTTIRYHATMRKCPRASLIVGEDSPEAQTSDLNTYLGTWTRMEELVAELGITR